MSALVVHGAHLAAGAHEADGDPLDDHPKGRVLRKVAGRAGTRPGQRRCRMSLVEFAEQCRRDKSELGLKQSEGRATCASSSVHTRSSSCAVSGSTACDRQSRAHPAILLRSPTIGLAAISANCAPQDW
jgi:hypothetical protein